MTYNIRTRHRNLRSVLVQRSRAARVGRHLRAWPLPPGCVRAPAGGRSGSRPSHGEASRPQPPLFFSADGGAFHGDPASVPRLRRRPGNPPVLRLLFRHLRPAPGPGPGPGPGESSPPAPNPAPCVSSRGRAGATVRVPADTVGHVRPVMPRKRAPPVCQPGVHPAPRGRDFQIRHR